MIDGYAGASTDVDAQARTPRAAGTGKVFRETASRAKTDRRSYNVSHSTISRLEALQSQ